MKKFLLAAVKIGISAAIIGYLVNKTWNDESFTQLYTQPKNWFLLLGAAAAAFISVSITFVRWQLLVRAQNVPFSMKEAFRLGFLGYLFNFFSVGIIGGDVLKSVFIARQHPERRTAAVTSVIFDRVIGLYALFVVAAVAAWFIAWDQLTVRDPQQLASVKMLCRVTTIVSIVGLVGWLVIMLPGVTNGRWLHLFFRLPKIGGLIEKLFEALHIYRQRPGLIVLTLLMSFVVHALSTFCVFFVATGLPGNEPALGWHFVIVPMSAVAGAVPLPGGLGAFEFALDSLYRAVTTVDVAERQGFIIALAYRVITMLIAGVGVVYYMSSRKEVDAAVHEAEQASDADLDESNDAPLATEASPIRG